MTDAIVNFSFWAIFCPLTEKIAGLGFPREDQYTG